MESIIIITAKCLAFAGFVVGVCMIGDTPSQTPPKHESFVLKITSQEKSDVLFPFGLSHENLTKTVDAAKLGLDIKDGSIKWMDRHPLVDLKKSSDVLRKLTYFESRGLETLVKLSDNTRF